MVFAVDHQHRRPHINGVARLGRGLGLPAISQGRTEGFDLLGIIVRGGAGQAHFLPVEGCRGLHIARHQARGLGVVEVGDHQHRGRMLDEAVGHFLQAQSHVLEADLLGHGQQGHGRVQRMDLAHELGQDRGVAHARIKQADGRRRGMQGGQLLANAPRHGGLLAAGADEGQVFLAIVVKAERRHVDRRGYGFHKLWAGWCHGNLFSRGGPTQGLWYAMTIAPAQRACNCLLL